MLLSGVLFISPAPSDGGMNSPGPPLDVLWGTAGLDVRKSRRAADDEADVDGVKSAGAEPGVPYTWKGLYSHFDYLKTPMKRR